MSWDELFIHVQGSILSEKEYYIYYGQAYCKYINDNTIIVLYAGAESNLNGFKGKPRVILNRSVFEKNRAKGLFDKLLKYGRNFNYKDPSSYFTLYYLGKFKRITSKTGATYISLDYTEPDFEHNIYISPNF